MRRFILRVAALFAAALCLCAQEYSATITGAVTDSSGASVPGARISAINLQTGLTLKSETNAQGHYVIPYLLPGQYKVRVEHEGFKLFEQEPDRTARVGPHRAECCAAGRAGHREDDGDGG